MAPTPSISVAQRAAARSKPIMMKLLKAPRTKAARESKMREKVTE
jgi:hypothetical protein